MNTNNLGEDITVQGVQFRNEQKLTLNTGQVQYSAVQCSAVRCGAVRCDAVRCDAVRCGAMRCGAVRCSAVQCSGAVRGSAPTILTEQSFSYQCFCRRFVVAVVVAKVLVALHFAKLVQPEAVSGDIAKVATMLNMLEMNLNQEQLDVIYNMTKDDIPPGLFKVQCSAVVQCNDIQHDER
jgi:hypothetical protein